jgi:hypothetical protein
MPYVLSHKINCAAGFNNGQGVYFPCTCALFERQTIERLQAKIDALMLEYCPDEMTEEQMANWARHQQPVSAEEQAKIEAALMGPNA